MTLTTPRRRLALFDLDHTLLPLDSDYAWGEFTIAIGWTDADVFRRRNDEFYAHYQAGTLDVHDYVRFATEAVRLRGPEQAAAAHERFMADVIRPNLRPQAQALVRSHQQAGDDVVIVTATNEFVTRPIAQIAFVRYATWSGMFVIRAICPIAFVMSATWPVMFVSALRLNMALVR